MVFSHRTIHVDLCMTLTPTPIIPNGKAEDEVLEAALDGVEVDPYELMPIVLRFMYAVTGVVSDDDRLSAPS